MYAALIYSHSISPRLQYIVDFLSHYYSLPFKLTSSEEYYLTAVTDCKINYSYHRIIEGEIWMHPHALLFESAIHPVKVECFEHAAQKESAASYACFFKAEGDLHFDLFAAIFFLITRYEEYLPHKKDQYGRYDHRNSIAFKNNFLNIPIINFWLEDFRNLLAAKHSPFNTIHIPFSFLPTYDIDMAWSYLHKGFLRNTGAILKQFFSGKWRSLSQRISVLRKKRQDPYDAYEWMEELHATYGLKPVYFFLVAERTSGYDKNISIKNRIFQDLIKRVANSSLIGLHPSWMSGDQSELLRNELQWLQQISETSINSSRQHFIRFELPVTYRRLLSAGISHEYSMGYGSINGFRASVATSFYWYDLKNDEPTKLMVHPFCFMDANAYYEQKLSPEMALKELQHYLEVVHAVHGQMITIWHNSFLGTDAAFEGWKEIYQLFIAQVTKVQKQTTPGFEKRASVQTG